MIIFCDQPITNKDPTIVQKFLLLDINIYQIQFINQKLNLSHKCINWFNGEPTENLKVIVGKGETNPQKLHF